MEEQGYGLLLRDMKRCIKGESEEESKESSWKEREEEKVVPKYLNMEKVPGVRQQDTVGSKIEALRMYLEDQIGDDFYRVYELVKDERDEDYETVKAMLGPVRTKFIPLVVQLIVCEDNYY